MTVTEFVTRNIGLFEQAKKGKISIEDALAQYPLNLSAKSMRKLKNLAVTRAAEKAASTKVEKLTKEQKKAKKEAHKKALLEMKS